MALSLFVIAVVTTAITALLLGVLIILREKYRDERDNKENNLRVNQEKHEPKNGTEIPKTKAQVKSKPKSAYKKKRKKPVRKHKDHKHY